jgi:hypothetical protein
MLTLLSRLRDTARIDAFLVNLAAGVYSKGDNEALVRAAGLLPPERAAALIERIIAGHAAAHFSACGDLLARRVAVRVTGRPADLSRGFAGRSSPRAAARPLETTAPCGTWLPRRSADRPGAD